MDKRPNFLVIIADQLAWKALPAYGNRFPRTPNLDRLASRSVRFDRAYTPCPLCQPARAAFWSGLFPHQTGVLSNGRRFPAPLLPETVPTIGSLFAGAGYSAVHFGKTHASGALRGFEVAPEDEEPVEALPPWPLNSDTFRDRATANKTRGFLRGYQDGKPFIAVADFQNPHNICGWVGANEGPHEDTPIPGELPPLPDNFADPPFAERSPPVRYLCCSHRRLSQAAQWNETNYRHYLAAYYHYIERLDADVGTVLEAMESRRDAAETFVLFFSDHGDGMGAHGIVTKHTSFHEESTRVPLMISGPGITAKEQNASRNHLVSLLDIAPTLCDLAGIAPPGDRWGKTLAPLLSGKATENVHPFVISQWHTEWGYTIEPGRMVRSDRFKYIVYREEESEELYDLETDPGETRNLAKEPAFFTALEEHRQLLREHLEQTNDPFLSLEPDVAPRWRSHEPGYANHRGPSAPEAG